MPQNMIRVTFGWRGTHARSFACMMGVYDCVMSNICHTDFLATFSNVWTSAQQHTYSRKYKYEFTLPQRQRAATAASSWCVNFSHNRNLCKYCHFRWLSARTQPHSHVYTHTYGFVRFHIRICISILSVLSIGVCCRCTCHLHLRSPFSFYSSSILPLYFYFLFHMQFKILFCAFVVVAVVCC